MILRSVFASAAAAALTALLLAGCGTTGGALGGGSGTRAPSIGTPGRPHSLGPRGQSTTRAVRRTAAHRPAVTKNARDSGLRPASPKGRHGAGIRKPALPRGRKGPTTTGGAGRPAPARGSIAMRRAGQLRPSAGAGSAATGRPRSAGAVTVAIGPTLAAQGKSLYTALSCYTCHGPQGAGSSAAPALNGTGTVPVLSTYSSPETLATFIHVNMPLTRPGSVTATQADALAAYIYYTLNHRTS